MKSYTLFAALSVALSACASVEPPPPAAPVAPPPAPPPQAAAERAPTQSVVSIEDEIRRACGIGADDAHFAFDSARIGASDYPTLGKLAQCFASGPLTGRQMHLVGHADPRGGEEYNLLLGGSRADSVKSFLVEKGLPGKQAATTSRGELDAKGTDDATWAEDRRVDIVLAR